MNRILRMTFWTLGIFWVILIILDPKGYGQELKLTIVEPKNDANVCWRTIVKGTNSDPKVQVFVAIHPMAEDKFYIQPIPNMRSDGRWEAYSYFGEPNIGIGEPFEIIAIASKNKKLFREKDILPSPLPDNPQIVVTSNPVTVKRAPCLHQPNAK